MTLAFTVSERRYWKNSLIKFQLRLMVYKKNVNSKTEVIAEVNQLIVVENAIT